jgi:hypothetical protein
LLLALAATDERCRDEQDGGQARRIGDRHEVSFEDLPASAP